MTELRPTDFESFFEALWSTPDSPRSPFQWQTDLATRVLEHPSAPWPEAIALPTASGKTACIDIAIFALAAQAVRLDKCETVTAPRRIFFVVDRRIIVDEAHERACKIAKRLKNAEDGILKRVADALRRIGASKALAGPPLAVHILRGGMYRSEAWARDPLQPTVVATTVDQIGSRLLFRAYGRGPSMWPVYAGLIGNDSLVLLDEAHCARPFLQTLRAVASYRQWAEQPLERCFHPVILSATPPADTSDRFTDQSNECRDPNHPLGQRQLAHKPTELRVIAKPGRKEPHQAIAQALVDATVGLLDSEPRAIVLFTNRVAVARIAHELLSKHEDLQAIKLTGRMRPADKDRVVDRQLKQLSSSNSPRRKLEQSIVVVATQTHTITHNSPRCCAEPRARAQNRGRVADRSRAFWGLGSRHSFG